MDPFVPPVASAEAKAVDPEFFDKTFFVSKIVDDWVRDTLPENGGRLLDFGCGEGETALGMACRWPGHDVVGVDLKDATERLRQRAFQAVGWEDLPPNLKLQQVVPGALPEAPFDLIFSWSVIEHVDRRFLTAILEDFYRILGDDGRLLIQIAPLYYSAYGHHVSWSQTHAWLHLSEQDDHFATRIQQAAPNDDARKGLSDTYTTLNKLTAEELRHLLESAGFFVERQYRSANVETPPERLGYIYRPDVVSCEQVLYLCRKGAKYPRSVASPVADLEVHQSHAQVEEAIAALTLTTHAPRFGAVAVDLRALCTAAFGNVTDYRTLAMIPGEGRQVVALEDAGAQVWAFEPDFGEYLRCLELKNYKSLRTSFFFGGGEAMRQAGAASDLLVYFAGADGEAALQDLDLLLPDVSRAVIGMADEAALLAVLSRAGLLVKRSVKTRDGLHMVAGERIRIA